MSQIGRCDLNITYIRAVVKYGILERLGSFSFLVSSSALCMSTFKAENISISVTYAGGEKVRLIFDLGLLFQYLGQSLVALATK
jgi:hypothetical protein